MDQGGLLRAALVFFSVLVLVGLITLYSDRQKAESFDGPPPPGTLAANPALGGPVTGPMQAPMPMQANGVPLQGPDMAASFNPAPNTMTYPGPMPQQYVDDETSWNVLGTTDNITTMPGTVDFVSSCAGNQCMPRDRLTAEDLLPGAGANYYIGINTQGSSLRNATLDIRGEMPNPRVEVSPWSQSTIDPSPTARPLQ
jgi:hypothetical protein